MGSVKLKFHVLWFLEIILKFFPWLRVLCFFFSPLFFISGSPAKDFSGFVLSLSSLFISSALAHFLTAFFKFILQYPLSLFSHYYNFIYFIFSTIFILYPPLLYFFLILFHFRKRCSTFLHFSQDTKCNFFLRIKEVRDHEFEKKQEVGSMGEVKVGKVKRE